MTPLDYVAVNPCGCVTAWASAELPPKALAKTVAEWIRSGRSVERRTTEQAREQLRPCRCVESGELFGKEKK